MRDEEKTSEELIAELSELRRRIADTERPHQEGGNQEMAPSDPRWHSLVSCTPLFVFILDRDHRIQFINHTDSRVSTNEVIGKAICDFSPPEYAPVVRESVEQVFRSGQPASAEYLGLRRDDQIHWYETHFGPIFENGEVVAVSGIAVNVTARKEAEQERDRNRAMLNSAIDCLPFDFFALGADGRYSMQNAISRQHIGEAIGKRPEEVCSDPATLALWQEYDRRAFAGERAEGEVEVVLGGQKRHFRTAIVPVRDKDKSYGILGINVDITDQKKAEEALKKTHDELDEKVRERTAELSEANQQLRREATERRQAQQELAVFRRFAEAAGQGFGMADMDTKIRYINSAGLRFFGDFRLEEVVGTSFLSYFPASERLRLEQKTLPILVKKGHWTGEIPFITPAGEKREAIFHYFLVRDDRGRPQYLATVATDITERKRAQERLRQSLEELQTIYDGMIEGLVITDIETRRFKRVNTSFCRMLRYSEKELLAASIQDIHPPEEVPNDLRRFQAAAEGRVSINEDRQVIRKDGSIFYADITGHPIFYDGRPCLLALFRDVTERRQAREAQEKEQQTLWHMLQASDHDRQLIAYEIHDGLAQKLAAAIMQFQSYEHLGKQQPNEAKTAYEAGVQMLKQAHAEARRLISGVRPPVLDESGIETAIAHLVHDHRAMGDTQIECHSDVRFGRLPPILENGIYRIAQEALTNACKHSNSQKIKITLAQDGDIVRLEVQDWGKGFDLDSIGEGRFGLEGIRQRARLLGGEVRIESQPGQGTNIRATLPLIRQR